MQKITPRRDTRSMRAMGRSRPLQVQTLVVDDALVRDRPDPPALHQPIKRHAHHDGDQNKCAAEQRVGKRRQTEPPDGSDDAQRDEPKQPRHRHDHKQQPQVTFLEFGFAGQQDPFVWVQRWQGRAWYGVSALRLGPGL
ncbi:hypothetical protein PE067_14505 [Paracoccus sp. DMF-8]|uniref:hypothetical protein n=1 Tax=Paracoccus sp. DMF-8 TaxID=3019445 RepID=UPI0023E40F61|nr:hypothetical protein [Paracoccus sp. DMF-8]MDF3607230.1 hypothetical protein [Paracoccus sp. DMF-8]